MSGGTLEHEAQAHITLARLLRKNRPPEQEHAVQKILENDTSTITKIEQILKLDGSDAHVDEESAEEGAVDAQRAAAQNWQPLRFTLGKLKNIIKLPHTAASFWSFVFGEHRRIKEFGKKTHIFAPTILLPTVHLDKAIPLFLSESLQIWADRLIDLLAPVLEKGWQHLTKRDYNMIVALKKLCDEIGTLNFRIMNFRDRYLIDRLRNIEALFFVFYYQSGSAERVFDSITRVLLAGGEQEEESEAAEEAGLLVKSILYQGYSLPSLYDLLLGLNMMKYHRAFTYTDLIASDLGEIFNTARFICEPKVKDQIENSAANLRKEILTLAQGRNRIRQAWDYLSPREDGQPSEAPLEAFYEFGESRFEGTYRVDRENVVRFVPIFLRKVDIAFAPLLIGKVRLEKAGPVAVFDPHVFLPQFDRFRRLGFKIEQLSFGYRIFSHGRYLGIRKEGHGTIAVEAEIVRFLQDLLEDFTTFGKKLADILNRASAEGVEAREFRPVDDLALRRGPFVIPFAGEAIVSRGYLGGRTVLQALELLVTLSFLLGVYLYDPVLANLKANEQELDRKVESQLHAFERIAEEPAFREVVTQILGRDLSERSVATPSPAAIGPEEPHQ